MRRLSADNGSVTIIVALTLTVLMGVAALVIDLGAATAEHRSLQTGADAAAIAVAQNCAKTVSVASACGTEALATAQTYFAANTPSSVDVSRTLDPPMGGPFGRVTVNGAVDQELMFAGMIKDDNEPLDVAAAATAQWGPIIATDIAFPLAACDGALPGPGAGARVVIVDPTDPSPPLECNGAPTEAPFGWIAADDVVNCTASITLLPVPTPLSVNPADAPPSGSTCESAVDDLFSAITSSSSPDERTRILPVYDAAAGVAGARPAYSLVAFEFTGARIGTREASVDTTEACPAAMHCIRGQVTYYLSPEDGPIADAATASLPGIAGTTVLDTRLVD